MVQKTGKGSSTLGCWIIEPCWLTIAMPLQNKTPLESKYISLKGGRTTEGVAQILAEDEFILKRAQLLRQYTWLMED